MRIAIIAALPGEIKPLVRDWDRVPSPAKGISFWVKSAGPNEYVAVCGGMGAQAAIRSFAAAEHVGSIDLVLSIGWAGALSEKMKPGNCYIASEVIDALSGERFSLSEGNRKQRLVTTPRVADAAEKLRLLNTYGADLVDMEAAAVARLAAIRGIPICCFKAISDGPGAQLPDLNPFIDHGGQFRLVPFLGYIALRPQFWSALLKLGRTSSIAADSLASTVTKFLEEKNVARTNETGVV